MSNYEKLKAMREQLDSMWEELILMKTSEDPVARLHKEDASSTFAKLIIQIRCMMPYEESTGHANN